MKEWTKEICSEKPEELQLIAADTYIQRKDIVEVNNDATEECEAYKSFECMSREISVNEYNMLKSIEKISIDKAIEDYTLQLIEEGVL